MSAIATDVLRHIAEGEAWIITHPGMAAEMWDDSEDRATQAERARKGETGRHAHRAQRLAAKKAEAEAADALPVRQEWNEDGTFMVTIRTLPDAPRQNVGNAALATRRSQSAAKQSPLKGVTGGRVLDSVTTSTEVHTLGALQNDYDRILAASRVITVEEDPTNLGQFGSIGSLIAEATDLGRSLARRPGLEREAVMMHRVVKLLRNRQYLAPRS